MEIHPRIDRSNLIIDLPKIILGSFPTWTLTDPDLEKNESFEEKILERNKNGDFPFFYGSSINKFWQWYQVFIDPNISRKNIDSIKKSLLSNSIGITDVIISCSRRNRSALDHHLTKRSYNHDFLKKPKAGEKVKILCTSKGVMNNMLLNNKFFKRNPEIIINSLRSDSYQVQFIKSLKGNEKLLKTPIYRVLEIENGGEIELLCIPSPGSPYRKLPDFGYNANDTNLFLNDYLKSAFKWFSS